MRPQTDLLILLTAVPIINDSQTNPPDPAGVSYKLIWEVKLSEGQEGTVLINYTICALSALVLSPLGGQQMGPTGALYPDLLWPIQRSPTKVYGQVPQNWDDCGGPSWSFL
jgi:hypothetical protein